MIRKRYIVGPALVLAIALIVIYFNYGLESNVDSNGIPSLPRPIAREAVLITSAGQSTDAYIIKDVANQLMIQNYFMPQAKEADLNGINTVVFVVGYSPLGTKLHGISFQNEKRRIEQLLAEINRKRLTVLTLYIGGKQRRGKETDELIRLMCANTDYLIGMREGNEDSFFSELAKQYNIPFTLIKGVNNIPEPFASAFR